MGKSLGFKSEKFLILTGKSNYKIFSFLAKLGVFTYVDNKAPILLKNSSNACILR